MKKLLCCILTVMLLTAACMYAAMATENSGAGEMRADSLKTDQLSDGTGTVLGSEILRSDIVSIQFADSLEGAPEGAWDVSAAGDGSVMAWVSDGALTIAGDGGVRAPGQGYLLFAGYKNAESIQFNGCFDTSGMSSMRAMFYGCSALKALDLSGFDTSHVTDMSFMFNRCKGLEALDVSGFDTSKVEDMNTMFQLCASLEALDLSGFDTSNVTAMDYMFSNCAKLKALDLSGFDTGKVTTMKRMFYGCKALEEIRMREDFGPGDGVDAEDMYTNTKAKFEYVEAPEPTLAPSEWPRMREDVLTTEQYEEGTGTVLGSDIPRSDITSIQFAGSLEGAPEGAWDVSEAGDGSVLAWVSDGALTIAGNGGVRAPGQGYLLFAGYTNAESIRFDGCFDTSGMTNMTAMFYRCAALKALDVSGFDTSNVTDMSYMFDRCEGVTALDVSGFDTSKVVDMNTMFQNCYALEALDVSGFDTSNVKAMDYMFNKCAGLRALDVSGFDTGKVTTMKHMFYGCKALEEIRMGDGFAIGEGVNTEDMFTNTSAAIVKGGETMTIDEWAQGDSGSEGAPEDEDVQEAAPAPAADGKRMRSDTLTDNELFDGTGTVLGSDIARGDITAIEFRNSLEGAPEGAWDVSEAGDGGVLAWVSDGALTIAGDGGVLAPENGQGLFANYTNLTAIRFNGCFDTAGTTNMYAMFSMDSALTELDVSWMDTSGVTDMFAMFNGCSALTALDISGFDTSDVVNLGGMFINCASLEALDVSGFDTARATDMSNMFNGCERLKALDVSGFDTSGVTSMLGMFEECSQLKALDVSGFDTSHVTDMSYMFNICEQLETLDVSGFDTSGVTDMRNMFRKCAQLKALDVSGFNTAGVTDMENMFNGCSAMKKIVFTGLDVSAMDEMGYMFANCGRLQELWVSDADLKNKAYTSNMFEGSPSAVVNAGGVWMLPEDWLGETWSEPEDAPIMRADRTADMPQADQDNETYRVLGSNVLRSDIVTVEFLDSMENVPSDGWDVSEAGDGSVFAWVKDADGGKALSIAGKGGVRAPSSCEDLFARYTSLKEIRFNGCFYTGGTQSMKAMFAFDSALGSLDLSHFDTSSVTDMGSMFGVCESLQSLNLFRFDTSHVTNMQSMFNDCKALESLDLSRFDTSNVTNMESMFANMSLKSLDLTGFDTSGVTDMSFMFAYDTGLERLDLSGFDTGKVKNYSAMFKECAALGEIAVGDGFVLADDGSLETWQMFEGCSASVTLDGQTLSSEDWAAAATQQTGAPVPEPTTGPKTGSMAEQTPDGTGDGASGAPDDGAWHRMREDVLTREEADNHGGTVFGSDIPRGEVRSIAFTADPGEAPADAWDISEAGDNSVMAWFSDGELTVAGRNGVIAPQNAAGLFAGYTNLKGVSFNGCFSTEETTDMSCLFCGDGQMTELDLTGFDTRRVENMQSMFSGCTGLEALNVSGFDTNGVTDMSGMFSNCNRLRALDVSKFKTGNVTNMQAMFFGCYRLEELDVAGFDTSRVTDMGAMFRGLEGVRTLDVTRFDTGNVTDMQAMFAECRSLAQLDLSGFNTAGVRSFKQMFMNCTRLDELAAGDTFIALGEPFPEDEDMLANGPLRVRNGDDVIGSAEWQESIRISPDLQKGDKGSSVKWLQRVLTKLGYLDGGIDGAFGGKTQSALKAFQADCGLSETGVADHDTLYALAQQAAK